jgi:hypothetical protein
MVPVKVGRKWRCYHFSSFSYFAFAERCHLQVFKYEYWACCGFAEWFPWRLGQCLLINFDSKFSVKYLITAVFESPGRRFPTPAGVMAWLVANNEFRNGLGGEVANC